MVIFSKASKEKILRSGDIYWVNLDPTIGDEIKKKGFTFLFLSRK
jgi:hypothetical protein